MRDGSGLSGSGLGLRVWGLMLRIQDSWPLWLLGVSVLAQGLGFLGGG